MSAVHSSSPEKVDHVEEQQPVSESTFDVGDNGCEGNKKFSLDASRQENDYILPKKKGSYHMIPLDSETGRNLLKNIKYSRFRTSSAGEPRDFPLESNPTEYLLGSSSSSSDENGSGSSSSSSTSGDSDVTKEEMLLELLGQEELVTTPPTEEGLKEEPGKDDLAVKSPFESLLIRRHAKAFFTTADNRLISLYRALLHGKLSTPPSEEFLLTAAMSLPSPLRVAVLAVAGGHFAGAIFKDNEPVLHKTFHSYTVRAKQGGSQGAYDSSGNHPKSAGASLRRYNEMSLTQHIQQILASWKDELAACHLVFIRSPTHGRAPFFGGKNPPLNKTDPRLRKVPIPTRRPTFNEVKRIHEILTSVEVYGDEAIFACDPGPPKSPPRPLNPRATTIITDAGLTRFREKLLEKEEQRRMRKGKKRKSGIDRAKSRLAVERPLPQMVIDLAISEPSSHELLPCPETVPVAGAPSPTLPEVLESEDGSAGADEQLYSSEEEIDLSERLEEFAVCFGNPENDIRQGKPVKSAVTNYLNRLSLLCNSGKGEELISALTEAPVDLCEELAKESIPSKRAVVNVKLKSKETLLHLACRCSHVEVIRLLMENGADPCLRDAKKRSPFALTRTKEARMVLREFMNQNPTAWDYSRSGIPPLASDDVEGLRREKKAEKRRLAREKKKERQKEEERRKKEEEEKAAFLNLSDREKRALAAEKRMKSGLSKDAVPEAPAVYCRCFSCGETIARLSDVFSAFDLSFCSPGCVAKHRKVLAK
ncbi:unnamed protein product [Cyprideis torosa]|uniref:VLRF1 domain-containing protein n=1 Tax=Cyprideis torosa TaxID=163714 RepID=A0A7R8ZM20_9CRUS|nr:unnamed protein product [Cyprideis torosa]CAG0884881.1 unnamed protein product [Cyprideis torosa]